MSHAKTPTLGHSTIAPQAANDDPNNDSSGRQRLAITDAEGRIIFADECFRQSTGLSYSELIGLRISECKPRGFASAIEGCLAKVVATGRVEHFEIISGKTRFENSIVPLRRDKGSVDGFAVIESNVTKQHESLEELRESQRMLRLVLDTIPVRVFWKDADSNYLGCNQSFANDSGLQSPSDLIGKNDWQMGWVDQAEAYRADDRYVIENGRSRLNYEEPQTTPDGKRIWLRTSKVPLYDDEGTINGVLGTYEDITAKKQTEESLKRSEERFRELFDSAPVGYHEIDENGIIVDVNRTELEMLGYQRDEMVGRPVWLFVGDAEASKKRVMAKLSGEVPPTRSSYRTYRRKDGSPFAALLEERLLLDPQKKIIGIRSVIQNITERMRAEEALRVSEERFRTTLYSIGDGVITADILGRILQMNPVAETLTGWSEKQAVGKPVSEVFNIISEETGKGVENPVHRVLREGTVVGLANHTVLVSKDGARRPIADSGAPIRNLRGETIGVVLVFNDQSEHRFLQAQLLQSQKMEAIGRLAGGIAHDFNNVIAVILGYAKLIEHAMSPLDPLARKVQAIASAAERSALLTRQLLAFARKQVIAPVVLNLNTALTGLHQMLTRLVGEDIKIELKLPGDLWNIKVDPTQIDQILANLATNSRDAIADVGAITVECSNVVIDSEMSKEKLEFAPGEYVMLAFSDNGCGMDKATIERIFEPFFTTKPKGQGSGLGLATVFGIVKQNGGLINVYSEVGRGTTFKVYFPRFLGDIAAHVGKEEDIPLRGTETILIVEDEEQLLDLAKSSLELFGYRVYAAKSPGDAILLCEKNDAKFDLLITDVVMPEMNGRELKERLDVLKPGMKVIFMSGYTADVVAHRGILDEGVNFLQKPFTPRGLARKARSVLNG
ncbi:MAG TPA: PAS domain S-box protein [Bacteroidota bacterium]|nr:PAS domain S-box protein [Bacteroidota bacterium]